ncbi:hypothetical protein EJ05DRAFT_446556 [Pseudovirgaria hyperparasitica]|uniref:BTB domain-containing protein n=1 Tax=Pseudovirgaria hyperparasitica TaxID=470096 RepID=A0A6A6VPK4_9PEZI|nr:uncharacterized protein EJ05DRAFT_446556 [Pseudovirgaria hyperparasitica]KAF2752552.1 hypothetical protein EJ05DRAFT_446556 [Pseudovirgaria hyperparasitica]
MAHRSDVFTSNPTTFLVGKEEVPMVVHHGVLAPLSDYFKRLLGDDSAFKEAEEKTVLLPQIKPDDFSRFCTFAYTGDYAAPPYVVDDDWTEELQTTPEFLVYTSASTVSKGKRTTKYADEPTAALYQPVVGEQDFHVRRPDFERRAYCATTPYEDYRQSFRVAPHSAGAEKAEHVFLAHARLYAFAKEKMVDSLISLSLQKLHKTLAVFTLDQRRYQDILALTRFAFSEDYPELQDMVALYHGAHFTKIGRFESFYSILCEEGHLGANLLRLFYENKRH